MNVQLPSLLANMATRLTVSDALDNNQWLLSSGPDSGHRTINMLALENFERHLNLRTSIAGLPLAVVRLFKTLQVPLHFRCKTHNVSVLSFDHEAHWPAGGGQCRLTPHCRNSLSVMRTLLVLAAKSNLRGTCRNI